CTNYRPFTNKQQSQNTIIEYIRFGSINNRIYCSEWFAYGGSMIYDDRTPSDEFLEKYYQKGFQSFYLKTY
ncbi:hypothetical protein BpHYR1_029345, partial [Brachionus plicatilis]